MLGVTLGANMVPAMAGKEKSLSRSVKILPYIFRGKRLSVLAPTVFYKVHFLRFLQAFFMESSHRLKPFKECSKSIQGAF